MTGMMVQSANDAAFALAEKVSGSERYFAPLMNLTAKNLGLTKTRFYTSSGLVYKSAANGKTYTNTMSAHDIAVLTRTILAKHPEIYSFSTIKQHTFHPGTSRQMKVTNTNLMLPTLKYSYKGVDGLKTGFTTPAKYCYVGTVNQKDFRLISVLLGSRSLDTRFTETKKLYDYIYKSYTPKLVLQAGRSISSYKTIRISGHNGPVSIVSLRNLKLPLLKGKEKNYSYHVVVYKNLRAPLKKGTAIGYVQIYYKGKLVSGTPRMSLVTASNVTKN
jgi:D-alanyl-D-alanine carboxypeptidase (penicillin-binding protein 5/6)